MYRSIIIFFLVFCAKFSFAQQSLLSMRNADRRLIEAAKELDLEKLNAAIKDSADVYAAVYKPKQGYFSSSYLYSPMLEVLNHNRKDMALALIEAGYDLNHLLPNERRISSYYLDSLTWVLPFLVEHGADIHYYRKSASGHFSPTIGHYFCILDETKDEKVRDYLFRKGVGEREKRLQGYTSYEDTVWLKGYVLTKKKIPLVAKMNLYSNDGEFFYSNSSIINGKYSGVEFKSDSTGYFEVPIFYTRKEFFYKGEKCYNLKCEVPGFQTLFMSRPDFCPVIDKMITIIMKKGKPEKLIGEGVSQTSEPIMKTK